MTDIWKDIKVADWNTLEDLLEMGPEVDWSKLPEDRDLFIEDLIAATRGWMAE